MSEGLGGSVSPAAVRQRRWRWRQRNKLVGVTIDLAPDAVDELVRLGWLGVGDRHDARAVADALIGVAAEAIRRGVTP